MAAEVDSLFTFVRDAAAGWPVLDLEPKLNRSRKLFIADCWPAASFCDCCGWLPLAFRLLETITVVGCRVVTLITDVLLLGCPFAPVARFGKLAPNMFWNIDGRVSGRLLALDAVRSELPPLALGCGVTVWFENTNHGDSRLPLLLVVAV